MRGVRARARNCVQGEGRLHLQCLHLLLHERIQAREPQNLLPLRNATRRAFTGCAHALRQAQAKLCLRCETDAEMTA